MDRVEDRFFRGADISLWREYGGKFGNRYIGKDNFKISCYSHYCLVYLRTEPEVVHERVKARSRKEEDCVSVDYLRELHNLHENWIYSSDKLSSKIPVSILFYKYTLTSYRIRLLHNNKVHSMAQLPSLAAVAHLKLNLY